MASPPTPEVFRYVTHSVPRFPIQRPRVRSSLGRPSSTNWLSGVEDTEVPGAVEKCLRLLVRTGHPRPRNLFIYFST